jgi:protein TonB
MMGYALTAPRPIYPRDVAKGMDGTVVLQVTISKQGNVTNTRTISGPVELHQAALQAVWAWHFRPYLLDGNPTEVTTTVELPFKGQ